MYCVCRQIGIHFPDGKARIMGNVAKSIFFHHSVVATQSNVLKHNGYLYGQIIVALMFCNAMSTNNSTQKTLCFKAQFN